MKTFLLYKDQDFNLQAQLPANHEDLIQDLGLDILFNAMANEDEFIFDVVRKAILSGENDIHTIKYRQDILKDCLHNPAVVREIYQIAIESDENKRRGWMGIFTRYPAAILSSSLEMVEMFMGLLRKLRGIADEHAHQFHSDGFKTFFAMIQTELTDEYFIRVQKHLKELRFRKGVLISAELGEGNEGTNYILRKPNDKKGLVSRVISRISPAYTFYIHPRDEHGARALSDLKDKGINLVANALGQSADHLDNYFIRMRVELAFYIGCLNLYENLTNLGEKVSFPTPKGPNQRKHSFNGLYDICLALTKKQKVIGNDINADNKSLILVTGANQGGKSTFLRSVGIAQLMMQCGMFVPADSFSANICKGIFTHFKRKEDASMKSGKLDEELKRMSGITDMLKPNSLILFNESFAATNEREGSEIARQITFALLENRIKVFFVTHQYDFANGFSTQKVKSVIFLRAERKEDGRRTYKVKVGKPLETSFGEDVYHIVFGGEKRD